MIATFTASNDRRIVIDAQDEQHVAQSFEDIRREYFPATSREDWKREEQRAS